MPRSVKRPLQIYLDPAQSAALRQLAGRRRTSMGALIRQSVQRYLEQELPVEEDPALGIVGLGRSGKGDLSAQHDAYLADAVRDSHQ